VFSNHIAAPCIEKIVQKKRRRNDMSQDTSPASIAKPAVEFVVPPDVHEEQRRRVARIKRAIRRNTSGGVRELKLEMRGDELLLHGKCASFYCKQVAQTTAMRYLSGQTLLNDIQVDARPR
jgi:hypothetical protein